MLTPDALTRSGDSGAHIQRGISRILLARGYLDLLVLCRPSLPDYMRVISGTGRGALALYFVSHGSIFKVPSDCYTMAAHHVLDLITERASQVRKCLGAMRLPQSLVGVDLYRRNRAPLCRVSAPQLLCLGTTPGARTLGTSFSLMIGLSTCLKSSCLKRGLLRGGACG
jgi:hypothetical protein